ncbi:MAG: hypothetical protein ACR2GO_03760, partial [Candidatus Limnocylindria bacterium]
LRTKTDEELIELHDDQAPRAEANVNYYLAEMSRREIRRGTDTMVRLTWAIFGLTAVVDGANRVQ